MAVRMEEDSQRVCFLQNLLRESQARERNLKEINAALMVLVGQRRQLKRKSSLEAEKEQLAKELKDDRKRAEAQQDALLSQIAELTRKTQELDFAYREVQMARDKEASKFRERLREAENERNSMKCALENLEKDYA